MYPKRSLLSLLVLMLFIALGCEENITNSGVPNTITGRVYLYDPDSNGMGLLEDHSGIKVEILGTGFSLTTGVDGQYAFSEVPPGLYIITFTKEGFDSTKTRIEYSGVGVEFVDDEYLRSKKTPVEIRKVFGVAKLLEKHFPDSTYDHKGISVSIEGTGISTTTDNYGRYTLENPPSGNLRILFNKSGFQEVEVTKHYQGEDTASIPVVTLESESYVTIDSFYYANGNELISAWFADSVSAGQVFFNGVGITSNHDLVVILAKSSHVAPSEVKFELLDGDKTTYDFELDPVTTFEKNGKLIQIHYRSTFLSYLESSYLHKTVTGRIKSVVYGRKIYSNVVSVPR